MGCCKLLNIHFICMIAMDVNMKTSLFKIQLEEVELVNNGKVDDINMDHLIESVMQDSITRVAKITTSNKKIQVFLYLRAWLAKYIPATWKPIDFMRYRLTFNKTITKTLKNMIAITSRKLCPKKCSQNQLQFFQPTWYVIAKWL